MTICHEAPGALPNGTRVRKSRFEDGDLNPVGTLGSIIGSLHHHERGYGYFVTWDTTPHIATLVVAAKIARQDA